MAKPKYKSIRPEDLNKDPKKLRDRMDKVFLDLDKARNKMRFVDHRSEFMENMDDYIANMRPFVSITKPDLVLDYKKFIHIGYYLYGDFYDLDGSDLYASKRWVTDIATAIKGSWFKNAWLYLKALIKRLLPFIATLCILANTLAQNPPSQSINDPGADTVALAKGEPAPFPGVLLNEGKAREVKNQLIDLDYTKKQVDIYKANEAILNSQVNLWKDQSKSLSEQLVETRDSSIWAKVGFFILGAGITVGTAYAIKGATK